ncbi:MAG: hypothetical protein Q4E38_10250, partial [Eubacteriales bacterium]|nr:hypothetical protein [Eubacteriales bacterium]
EWHFVSPDGTRDLTYLQAQAEFPTLKIKNGYAKDMTLDAIPLALSGWKVYCRFTNDAGSVNSGSALITVRADGTAPGSSAPQPYAPVPAAGSLPVITKNPTDETVTVNGKCQFVTRYDNAKWAEWHFVSPDGTRDLTYLQAQTEFPTLKIQNGYAKDMTLDAIPLALNGWKVYCRFSNDAGSVSSGSALITVRQDGAVPASTVPQATSAPATVVSSLPVITKDPTDEIVNVNGKCQFVTRYENAKWAEWHFVSPDGTRDLDYDQMQKEFPTMKVLNGFSKDLTLDAIPQALNGWKVYCRFINDAGATNSGSARITVRTDAPAPAGSTVQDATQTTGQATVQEVVQATGRTMTVYYSNGTPVSVTEYNDGTWRTANGTLYYLGTDGVLRARGQLDLYTRYPSAG